MSAWYEPVTLRFLWTILVSISSFTYYEITDINMVDAFGMLVVYSTIRPGDHKLERTSLICIYKYYIVHLVLLRAPQKEYISKERIKADVRL